MLGNTIQVLCNEAHLRHNFRLLRARDPLLPVIKADAYGHDMLFVAKVLEDEGALGMAVGTVSEGLALRKAGISCDIILLLGILGADEALLALKHNLIPIAHSLLCIQLLEEAACQLALTQVPVALKLDTGLGRLGFTLESLPFVLASVQENTRLTFTYMLSHFAAAESTDFDAYTAQQSDLFVKMASMVCTYFPSVRISFSNSAALYTSQPTLQQKLRKALGMSQEIWGRPGLALYGLNPLHGTQNATLGASPYAALKPVMSVTAPVLAVHDVQAGASLGYHCTFTAPHAMRVAIVGIGYAHGYARQFSNTAAMIVQNVRAPVVGRIFMQTTMLDVTHIQNASAGDRAYVLGGAENSTEAISVYELADWAQTIPYAIVCDLGKNLHCAG